MAETRELELEDPNMEPKHAVTAQGGLSPLILGVLLGMIVLAGVVIWIVLHSRIDDLDQQFTRLDERFQVMATDVGRQGDALRQYLADPDATTDRGTSLSGLQGAVESRTEALARSQAELRMQLDALAADLKGFDGRLAGLEKRIDTTEKTAARPAPAVIKPPPKPAARPVPTTRPAPATRPTPPEPPAGYQVVLASLPIRDQAIQELDRLRARGLEVVLREAKVKNGIWYRIQAEGFVTRDAAKAFAREAESRHGVAGAWVAAP
jgi:cell division septation protein DedD